MVLDPSGLQGKRQYDSYEHCPVIIDFLLPCNTAVHQCQRQPDFVERYQCYRLNFPPSFNVTHNLELVASTSCHEPNSRCMPTQAHRMTISREEFKTELDSQFESAVKVDMIPERLTSPTKIHTFGILDLPNEILIFILEDLEDEDLFSLVLLSRQLHHLALPIYLSRNGISSRPSSQLLLFDDRSNSILKALNTALFRPTLNSLLCTLICHTHPDDLSRQLLMINRLVEKVSTLQEASIVFDKVDPLVLAKEEFVMSRFFGDVEDPNHGWAQEFGKELTVMMELILASGCRSFTISHSGTYIPPSDEIKTAILANFHGFQFIKKKVTKLLRPFSSMFPKLYPTTTNTLKTFNFHSPIAMHPDLCRWTINTLNHSNLTSLSISQNRSTETSVWSLVLPCITIASLSHLSIDLCSIKTGDLFKFLRRHPLIQNLILGRNILLPDPSQTLIKTALKHLSKLTAHPKWLVHLLTPQGCFPALSCVRILWRIQNKQYFSFATLNGLLEPIACRLGSLTELHLVLSFGSISPDWMVPSSTFIMDPDIRDCDGSNSRSPPLTFVTHLELQIGTYSLPLAVATRLPKWLIEFPVLTGLKIMTLSQAGPFCDSEKDSFVGIVLGSELLAASDIHNCFDFHGTMI